MASEYARTFQDMALKELRKLLKQGRLPTSALLAPLAFAMLAALAEGASCSLFVPALQLLNRDPLVMERVANYSAYVGLPSPTRGNAVLLVVAATLFLMLTRIVAGYISCIQSACTVRTFISRLRATLLEELLYAKKEFFDSRSAGTIQEVVTTYISSLAQSIGALHGAMFSVACLLVYFGIMVSISWQLTAISIATLPVLAFAVRRVMEKLSHTSYDYSAQFNQFGTHLSNMLGNISLIKASSAEVGEAARFTHRTQHLGALEYSLDKKNHLLGPVQELGTLCIVALLFALFGFSARANTTTLAQQLVFILVLRRSANLMSGLNGARGSLVASIGTIHEITTLLDCARASKQRDGRIPFTHLTSDITISHLTFSHGRANTVLQDVSLRIQPGQFIGIVGQSGSGKSTLLSLLLKLYDPPPGAITLDGDDILDLKRDSYLDRVAYVAQDTYLFHGTLRENLVFGLPRLPTEDQILHALHKAQLLPLLERLPDGLSTPIGERGVMFSGGERQRISLARAILREADIWLLDEPTSALDPSIEVEIMETLEPLLAAKTVVMVSHRLTPLRNAHQIYQMDNGRLTVKSSLTDVSSQLQPGEKSSESLQ